MQCSYCFYADESAIRSIPSYGVMTYECAEKLIDRAFEFTDDGVVSFAFQGGEPTLAKIDFFEHFVSYASEKKPNKVKINYSIQTNGILLDDLWCELFAKNDFLVGLSVDGPEWINDFCRKDKQNTGSFRRIMKAARLLKKHSVEFNILTVLTKQAAKHPRQLWNFYSQNSFDYIQIIPCLAPLENPRESYPFTLTPREYADFLKSFFMIWSDELAKGNYISMRLFDNIVSMAMGRPPEMCGMLGSCSAQFVAEADGSIYPCDFYVLDEYKLGNVFDLSFAELANGDKVKQFLFKGFQKPSMCGKCEFFGICRGGCRRYRDFYTLEKDFCPYADFLKSSLVRISNIAKILNDQKGDFLK